MMPHRFHLTTPIEAFTSVDPMRNDLIVFKAKLLNRNKERDT